VHRADGAQPSSTTARRASRTRPQSLEPGIPAHRARLQFIAVRINQTGGFDLSILWIVIIVILVLALLGYFGRGRFYG